MNQDERLNELLKILVLESSHHNRFVNPDMDQRMLLRSLMNIRMPEPISEEFLIIQDAFLKEEARRKGIVTLQQLPTVQQSFGKSVRHGEIISLWKGDITRLEVDAIVNAANGQMLGCFSPCHNCIDNAIHSAAGLQLRADCYAYMVQKNKATPRYVEPTGTALVTAGYNLPAKHVIHTVGPIVQSDLTLEHMNELRQCYLSILKAAVSNNIRTLAFCCISTGVFQFPNEAAAEIAITTVKSFLDENERHFDRIIFNVFKDEDERIYQSQLSQI